MGYKVYLAGPIQRLTWDEANEWREYVEVNTLDHIKCLNPLRGKEYLKEMAGSGDSTKIKDSYKEYPMSTPSGILGRDRWDATRCDILFVNFLGAKTQASIGTSMEIAWADLHRVPILLVIEDEGNIHDHSMITGCATWRVNNLEDAVKILNASLTP